MSNLGCIAAIGSGTLFVWTSPAIPKIIDDKVNYNISLDEASYFTVLPSIGAICSSVLFAYLSDAIGRKTTLLLIVIPQATAFLLMANARSVYLFYIARFISGFSDSCIFTSLSMYIGEVATPKVRGTWGNLMTFSLYFGQVLMNIIGSYRSIPEASYICLCFPILFFCAFIFMPESPYFYLIKGHDKKAYKSLQKLRRKSNVDEELSKLKSDVDRQMSESGTWKDLFTITANRKALYAALFLRASQQFAGIACFGQYTQYIFEQSGGDFSPSTSAIIFSSLCWIFNFIACFTLDKFGRRTSYIYSLLFSGISLSIATVYFTLQKFDTNINLQPVNWIPLASMISYVFFYSFGIGIIPTLMMGELFSASIKSKGLQVTNIIFGVMVSSITKLFHLLDSSFGLFAPYLFFSVGCFVSTVLAFYFVPETKGKTLEEIQQSLQKRKKSVQKY